MLCFALTADGPVIAPEDLAAIHEVADHADSPDKIGIYLAKQLCRKLGGDLNFT